MRIGGAGVRPGESGAAVQLGRASARDLPPLVLIVLIALGASGRRGGSRRAAAARLGGSARVKRGISRFRR